MISKIDPSKPADGVPAVKADIRANFRAAKAEIEALLSGVAREILVEGARTIRSGDLGLLLTYSGNGDVWTLTNPGRAGEIAIENAGGAPITLRATGVHLVNGVTTIDSGKSASLRFFAGGAKLKVFVER